MELRQLAHFIAVAEEGSFTRASERMHIVQSAMSSSIRSLERELGTSLFERTTQRVRLSDAGRVFLPEARRTLAAADAARDAIDAVRGGLRGTVKLGTMQALRIIDVPLLLAQFHHDHPHVDLHIRHAGGGSAQLAQQVRDGELDLAILAAPERRIAGLELAPLAHETLELACHVKHPLLSRKTIDLADLVDTPFIDFPVGWGVRAATDVSFAAAGVRRAVTMETNDVIELTRLVAVGLAVALLPPSIATDAGLRTIPIRRYAPSHQIALATASVREPGAAARALIAAVNEQTRRSGSQ